MKKDKRNGLEVEIDRLTSELSEVSGEEYETKVAQITSLTEANQKRNRKISKDVLVSGAFSIAGILAMLAFERSGVITSKATSFINKVKLP